jgi:hypothetical protein
VWLERCNLAGHLSASLLAILKKNDIVPMIPEFIAGFFERQQELLWFTTLALDLSLTLLM